MSTAKAARYLYTSNRAMQCLAKSGTVFAWKEGRFWRFSQDRLDPLRVAIEEGLKGTDVLAEALDMFEALMLDLAKRRAEVDVFSTDQLRALKLAKAILSTRGKAAKPYRARVKEIIRAVRGNPRLMFLILALGRKA